MASFLAPNAHNIPIIQQTFYFFSPYTQTWMDYRYMPPPPSLSPHYIPEPRIRLISWNVDNSEIAPAARMQSIIEHIDWLSTYGPGPIDVILFQEVCPAALQSILSMNFVQEYYLVSDIDPLNWRGPNPSFGSVTLVLKDSALYGAGYAYRVPYPSHMSRDALCCDLVIQTGQHIKLFRVINVHLDSLNRQRSLRPTQLSICASHLLIAGSGCVMGDFNAIAPEDARLSQNLGMVDAWEASQGFLSPRDPGYTWGVQIKESFPPGRLDRAALVGNVEPLAVKVLPCGQVATPSGPVIWSDHCGLLMELGLNF